jgi:uncharacterized repeat protein (TIGR03803 family)
VTTTGAEKAIYSFAGGRFDGANPKATLIDLKGVLYGTTYYGGAKRCGTIFSITPTGEENVLYSFTCGYNGRNAAAGLTYLKGTLYGTTVNGGLKRGYRRGGCGRGGCGIVFAFTP